MKSLKEIGNSMVLRGSKFYGFCYADEISEKEFFAKNFKAIIEAGVLKLSFDLVSALDASVIKNSIDHFTFFEIEDVYLKNKLLKFLKNFPQIKKIAFVFKHKCYPVKRLKITHKGFLITLI